MAKRLEELRDRALHLRGGGARGRVEVPALVVDVDLVLELRDASALLFEGSMIEFTCAVSAAAVELINQRSEPCQNPGGLIDDQQQQAAEPTRGCLWRRAEL